MTLTANQFPAFYRAVNGYPPFPWQTRLVETITAAGGLWPTVLDLPTSSGKTSALDAAVFLLAMQAGKSVHERTAALRTFFVVDRRIVVDEAGDKARKMARLLNAKEIADPVVKAVADGLRQYGGDEALHVSVLRGGMYRDGSWADSPTQPTICLSTVDQVGSRLLFRGYGVSPYQRALHAGLVGNDALILLDEAHLSRPFLETLKAVEFYRSERWAERPVKTPFQVVVMSATAGSAVEPVIRPPDWKVEPFRLWPDDRNDPILKQRLGASKRAELREVRGVAEDENENRREFAEAVAGFARELAAPSAEPKEPPGGLFAGVDPVRPVQVIGIVVNRVDTARRVYRDLLAGRNAEAPDFDVILLTGRIRPYDRDRLLDEWFPYMEAKKDRPAPKKGKLYLVATQTVEVGANLSFDALVTEAAPIDALRQRFGRLDRLGLRGVSRAIIATRKDLLRKEDPVYGTKIAETWKWLGEHLAKSGKIKIIDFGIDAMAKHEPAELESLCASSAHAPVMMPAHVDDWVQTSVAPVPDPDPALFLHGPKSGPADVSVVWRADVTEELLRDADTAREVVALVPPTSMEALPLPIWHVRSWLRDGRAAADFTDLEGEPEPNPNRRADERKGRPFLLWKGPDEKNGTTVSHDPEEVYPGCTIVVPSSYGGCDEFGWDAGHRGDVADVADDCSWRAKRRPVLRVQSKSGVHLGAFKSWRRLPEPIPAELVERLPKLLTPESDTGEIDWDDVAGAFRGLPRAFGWLRNARRIAYPDGSGIVLVGRKRTPHPGDPNAADAPGDEGGGSFTGTEDYVLLQDHCQNVQKWVDGFALALGLDDAFLQPASRAALLHDAGKADPRFQEWLYGSEAAAARNGFAPIAKSKTERRNAAAVEAARKRAGWPKGGRHEAASVLLARSDPKAFAGVSDPELCEYLLGSHHGRCRPLWPYINDDDGYNAPGTVSLSLGGFALSADLPARPEDALAALHAGWVDLFWRMVRRYGYWGLAYLETLVVLADHRQSTAEREKPKEKP